jgi:hypothetical protein
MIIAKEIAGKHTLSETFLTSYYYHRLLQNRKSAKKCRQKKKAEFGVMRQDVG